MKYLFKNADIVIDQRRLLHRGSLLIEDDKILDHFYDGREVLGARCFDLHGSIIMPLPLSPKDPAYVLHDSSILDDELLGMLLNDEAIFLRKEHIKKDLLELLLRLKDYRKLIYLEEDLSPFIGMEDIMSPLILASMTSLNAHKENGLYRGRIASFILLEKNYRPFGKVIKGRFERILL